MQAEQVLTADYEMSDEPLVIDDIDGLREAIEQVQDAKDGVDEAADQLREEFGYTDSQIEELQS